MTKTCSHHYYINGLLPPSNTSYDNAFTSSGKLISIPTGIWQLSLRRKVELPRYWPLFLHAGKFVLLLSLQINRKEIKGEKDNSVLDPTIPSPITVLEQPHEGVVSLEWPREGVISRGRPRKGKSSNCWPFKSPTRVGLPGRPLQQAGLSRWCCRRASRSQWSSWSFRSPGRPPWHVGLLGRLCRCTGLSDPIVPCASWLGQLQRPAALPGRSPWRPTLLQWSPGVSCCLPHPGAPAHGSAASGRGASSGAHSCGNAAASRGSRRQKWRPRRLLGAWSWASASTQRWGGHERAAAQQLCWRHGSAHGLQWAL